MVRMLAGVAARWRSLLGAAPDRGEATGMGAGGARSARQMSTLLGGGVTPERMFELLGQDAANGDEALRVAHRVASGVPPVDALACAEGAEWRVLAAAWRLAVVGGAPLGPALARIGEALAVLDRLHERRGVILAGPKATVATVAALPPLALLLGASLGFDPGPVLGSPMGAVLLVAGALLLVSGVGWARVLQRRVETGDHVAGLEYELAWIVVRGGANPGAAPRLVADAVDAVGAEWVPFTRFLAGAPLNGTIAGARQAGVPLAAQLLEEAQAARSAAHARLEREAEQLGIRILIPLAVCVLPSFILVGVVPVVLSMLRV